jgi:hypothetical protein
MLPKKLSYQGLEKLQTTASVTRYKPPIKISHVTMIFSSIDNKLNKDKNNDVILNKLDNDVGQDSFDRFSKQLQ